MVEQLKSETLRKWAALSTRNREAARAVIFDLLERPADQRAEWLQSESVSDDCRDVINGLFQAGKFTVDNLNFRVLEELVSRPAAQPGDRFDEWEVLDRIGHGGMGEVYLAQRIEDDFEQVAAMKLLPPMMDNASAKRWFSEERKHLAHMGRLIDGGITETGQQFLVMEYASEGALVAFCDRKRFGMRTRLELFCELCEEVEHMHREGIIHCDIKPENVLIGADKQVRLVDLSIARRLDSQTGTAPSSRSLRFTERYGAPEQKTTDDLSKATDIFSLGRLLEELLVGSESWTAISRNSAWRPLRARMKTCEQCSAIAAQRGLSRRKFIRCLGIRADRILARAMAHNPQHRYGSVGALRDDVSKFLFSLANPSLSDRDLFLRFLRRLGGRAALASLGLVAISMAAGFWLGQQSIN